MVLDFFPENALGDGPKNSRIRVKTHPRTLKNGILCAKFEPKVGKNELRTLPLSDFLYFLKRSKEKHFHGLCLYKYKDIDDNIDLKSFENKFYILHDKHDLEKLLSDEK